MRQSATRAVPKKAQRPSFAEMQARIDALEAELQETLEQQTATAEVLRVINSSPGDLQPVFDAMLEKAIRICEAAFGALFLCDGERLRAAATHGLPDRLDDLVREGFPVNLSRLRVESAVHIVDLTRESLHDALRAAVDLGGARTMLNVALRRDDVLLGTFSVFRQEVRPYTDKQIALLQDFAAQAVIAMENARLITETREALEQQTATAEVLQVINSSPGNLTPVFDAMLNKATGLCGAAFGLLFTISGGQISAAALHHIPRGFADFLTKGPVKPAANTTLARAIRERKVMQIEDAAANPAYRAGDPFVVAAVEHGGVRTVLSVPLIKDDVLIGIIGVYRQEVRQFTAKQIALVENFAAQAVIAMENARLITETREALEQQTATAEVLGVINASPGDLTPVFDAMLERVLRLCGAAFGALRTWDGEHLARVSWRGPPGSDDPSPESVPIAPGSFAERVIRSERAVSIPDLVEDETYHQSVGVQSIVRRGGARSCLSTALRKDDQLLGTIVIYRQEVHPFGDKDIAILDNFAAQAVIAIENARLLTELRESLEQQRAMSEVLQVINSSPGNLQPVFDVVLEKALRLCEVPFGALATFDGDKFVTVTAHGFPDALMDLVRRPFRPKTSESAMGQIIAGRRFGSVADMAAAFPENRDIDEVSRAVVASRIRTTLAVPLRKDDALLGAIYVFRQEVRPFTEKQIGTLENFAAQAVIAMDNARLLEEIRQRQAELRVTFDNMGDGVAMFDADLRLAAWNRNYEQIIGLADSFLSQRPTLAEYVRHLAVHDEFGAVDVEAEVRRITDRVATQWSAERMRPDGRVVEVRHNPVPDGGFVLIYSDVTERKRAEAEIHAARDAAETALGELQTAQASLVHAQKMAALGQLTAGIAHEIKNPLNFVNNFAGLSVELLDELKEAAAPGIATLDTDTRVEIDDTMKLLTGNLEKIAEHGKRADGIVKSMLEHSRGGSGDRREVDLNALVDEVLNLAYHGARAQDQRFNITLERQFDEALAPIEVVPQDVTRVFLNLIGNGFYAAAKRSREAADGYRPVLRVLTRDVGEAVEIRIRDNGTGISPEIRDKLFQPFVTTKPTGEGTGLGLSISYEIVTQQHGGTIEVDSAPGEFTEFTVRLPRRGNGRGAETRA